MSKQAFRDWNPRSSIRIKYRNETGETQVWEASQKELLENILTIIDTYTKQEITLTSRQLYYQLVAGAVIPNSVETYKRICTFLTDARYAGVIDWDAIEDRGRTPEKHPQWGNVQGLIKSAGLAYRLPRWADQRYYVELYCEKQAMESVLKPVADKYHIYFGCNRGYSSASTMHEIGQRLQRELDLNDKSKPVKILYLGDHDSSGIDMVRDIKERLCEFIWGWQAHEAGEDRNWFDWYEAVSDEGIFQVIPVALTMEQIKKYNPPPNPAKTTDPRAKGYIRKFGDKSWELDALNPKILIGLTETAIQQYLDCDKYNAICKREEKELGKLLNFAKTIK